CLSLVSRDLHHLPIHSFPTRRSSDLFQTALRGKANVNPNIITSKTSGERIVAVAAPIYDDSNRIAGVLGFSVSVEYIQSLVVDIDRKSTRLNSSHVKISYAVFCLKKK